MAAYNSDNNSSNSMNIPHQPSPTSTYLDGLNMLPSATSSTFDADSNLFPNNQFFDFDINRPLSAFAAPADATNNDTALAAAFGNLAEPMNPFAEFTHFSTGSHNALDIIGNSPFPSLPSSANTSTKTSPANGIQGGHPSLQSRPTVPNYAHFEKHFGTMLEGPQTGDKRNSTMASLPSVQEVEEQTRLAAEEDKRRRNTAASARFRVKKKQREQALERSAKDMTDKVQNLESRVNELEMENKWLKEMLIERNLAAANVAGRSNAVQQSNDDGESPVASMVSPTKTSALNESSPTDKIAKKIETQHRKRGIGTTA